MASILNGKFWRDDMTSKAMGGTELLANRLVDNVNKKYLRDVEIHISRATKKDDTKKQLLWVHDLAEDPAVEHLKDRGWEQYEMIVFVSHWQQQMYNKYLGVPFSKGVVIRNAIEPIEPKKVDDGKIKMIYTSTPHRGLNILYPAFDALCSEFDNIELDVYSSFKLYGWEERDEPFKNLFDALEKHPKINYHGSKSNDEVRDAVAKADMFVYPSTWQETSCLCLIEAMSAGCLSLHSSLGALPETSMSGTYMYQYSEDQNRHATVLYHNMKSLARALTDNPKDHFDSTNYRKPLVDTIHGIDRFKKSWESLLKGS